MPKKPPKDEPNALMVPQPPARPSRGQQAEQLAVRFLQQQGLQVLHCNVQARVGELDVVALHGAVLVFVEVRLRRQGGLVSAAESVSVAKQRKLIRAAQWFLQRAPEHEWRECRFDVLAFASLLQPPEWICGAFTA